MCRKNPFSLPANQPLRSPQPPVFSTPRRPSVRPPSRSDDLSLPRLPIVRPEPGKRVPPIRTQARSATILPNFVGLKFQVHNGKVYYDVTITEDMVGHKLGEFSPYAISCSGLIQSLPRNTPTDNPAVAGHGSPLSGTGRKGAGRSKTRDTPAAGCPWHGRWTRAAMYTNL